MREYQLCIKRESVRKFDIISMRKIVIKKVLSLTYYKSPSLTTCIKFNNLTSLTIFSSTIMRSSVE